MFLREVYNLQENIIQELMQGLEESEEEAPYEVADNIIKVKY